MRILLSVLLLSTAFTSLAQDDFPDYRSKKDNFIKIAQKDIRGDLASFSIAGIDESTGKGKLKSIPSTYTDATTMKFEGNNVPINSREGSH